MAGVSGLVQKSSALRYKWRAHGNDATVPSRDTSSGSAIIKARARSSKAKERMQANEEKSEGASDDGCLDSDEDDNMLQRIMSARARVNSTRDGPTDNGHPVCITTKTISDYKAPRQKTSKTALSPGIAAAAKAADANGLVHILPEFACRRFATFDEFEDSLAEHFATNFAGFRRRSSLSAYGRNLEIGRNEAKARITAEKNGKPLKPYARLPWDDKDRTFSISFWCLHGCTQKSRGNGERYICSTRFTGCRARIKGTLTQDKKTNEWFVQVSDEYPVHNHTVSEAVFKTYNTSAMPPDKDLFNRLAYGVSVGGDAKLLRDDMSRQLGTTYSQRQMDNFEQYWLGGVTVLEGVKDMVELFSALPGSRSLIIDDDNGVANGFVFQSSIQRLLVERYGDTLVLDWTHNTNNMGFHLGSLMVTTANGTGVSVLDFLCVSQSNAMMRAVFEFFVRENPGAKDKLESVVIDKDYREWKTVEKVFDSTTVVLCIFHVLKWFKLVITQSKYQLDMSLRPGVMQCLRSMVFAVSTDDLEAQKANLKSMLEPDKFSGHGLFLDYLAERWYDDEKMWSYCGRGFVFTAGNTTSNRLESFWNQFKATLGGRKRLDLCIESIFQHATTILRREEALLAAHLGSTPVDESVDAKLRSTLLDMSSYAARLVKKQWRRYESSRSRFSASVGGVVNHAAVKHDVRVSGVRELDFDVDSENWVCSCRFYHSVRLPCRHLMFVAIDVLSLPGFPPGAIVDRWRMSKATMLLPAITKSIAELEMLRTRLYLPAGPAAELGAATCAASSKASAQTESPEASPAFKIPSFSGVAHVQLRKGEISDSRVLHDLQKRAVGERIFAEPIDFAMGLSTPDSKVFLRELGDVVAEFVFRWRERKHQQSTTGTLEDHTRLRGRERTFEPTTESAQWRACRGCADDDEDCDIAVDEEHDVIAASARSLEPAHAAVDADAHANLDQVGPVLRRTVLSQVSSVQSPVRASGELDILFDFIDSVDIDVPSDLSAPAQPQAISEDHSSKRRKIITSQPSVFAYSRRLRPSSHQSSVQRLTLRAPSAPGNRKTTSTTRKTRKPSATVDQADRFCPLDVFQMVDLLLYSTYAEAVFLQPLYPKAMQESVVLNRNAVAQYERLLPRFEHQFTFVPPSEVEAVMRVAVEKKREEDGAAPFHAVNESQQLWEPQYVARIGSLREFPEAVLHAIRDFYDIQSLVAAWCAEVHWVSDGWDPHHRGWEPPADSQSVPFLQDEADAIEGLDGTLTSANMRDEICRMFRAAVLGTKLVLPIGTLDHLAARQTSSVYLRRVVGHLAINNCLNDWVVNFALQTFATRHADVVVIDSLNDGHIRVPKPKLCDTRVVCFPLHYNKSHWCVIHVVFSDGNYRVRGYDPIVSTACHTYMKSKWAGWCQKLIGAWLYYEIFLSLACSDGWIHVEFMGTLDPMRVTSS